MNKGLYARFVYPKLMERALSGAAVTSRRREHLAELRGKILEIGFGTGLNLPCYPSGTERITAVDPNPGLLSLAAEKIKTSGVAVDFHAASAEALPFAPDSFDCVVSSWTLCSVGDLERGLAEVRRVLKEDGRFFFLEHARSPIRWIRTLQAVCTPFFKLVGDGCHLNRDFETRIAAAGFEYIRLQRIYQQGIPRLAQYMVAGIARKR